MPEMNEYKNKKMETKILTAEVWAKKGSSNISTKYRHAQVYASLVNNFSLKPFILEV